MPDQVRHDDFFERNAVRTAILIASLLLIAACASNRVDPLLVPPEANMEPPATPEG
jgi:hypothetical protein